MDSFTRDGLVFDVTDAGPAGGEVIVLLHGFPENRTCWEQVTPLLTQAGFRVLAPDQRGYSPRARPPRRRDYRISLLVEDVLALIDASGAERVHLVGHDWGGAVGWALAATHPERLHSFTSLTTPHPAAMAEALVRSGQLLRSWYMLLFQLPLLPERLVPRLRTLFTRGGLPGPALDRYLGMLSEPGALRAALNWYRAIPLSRSSVPKVRVPTLFAWASEDVYLGRDAAERTARHVQGPYRFEVLEGHSHWLPEEAPQRVASLVREHVRSITPGSW